MVCLHSHSLGSWKEARASDREGQRARSHRTDRRTTVAPLLFLFFITLGPNSLCFEFGEVTMKEKESGERNKPRKGEKRGKWSEA